MKLLRQVRGQERAEKLLSGSFSSGRLSHAHLFAGPAGVGRLTAALELSAALMCGESEESYCCDCRDCRRVMGFQHPDVRLTIPVTGKTKPEEIGELLEQRVSDGITPVRFQGNTRVTIDQIREMEERLSRKAFEDHGHIEIILDADRMGVEASNALLKTLEEPPEDTVIILISSRWSALLPTVRSRAHLVRFRRLPVELIRELLIERLGLDEEGAGRIAVTSDGCPGRALLRGAEGSGGRSEYDPAEVLKSILECREPSLVLAYSSKLSRKLRRESSLELSREMRSFMHDLGRMNAGLSPISHTAAYCSGFSPDEDAAVDAVEVFRRAQERLRANVMPKMVLGAAFSDIWKTFADGGNT